MTDAKIVKATVEDLPSIMETFIACTSEMRKHGIDQWDYQYPEPATVLDDIRRGEVFVIKNHNRCLATVTIDDRQDKQYAKIGWKHRNGKVLVMHRLAVHPLAQGEGLGKLLCRFTEEFALDNGYSNIRLDAYSGNPVSNCLYLDLGYEKAEGHCYFHGNPKPFYCYEKDLS